MSNLRTKYDPKATVDYGKWHCPTCDVTFRGGGPSLHDKKCCRKDDGYESCTYLFTKVEVARIKAGYSINGPIWLDLDYLRTHHSELL